MLHWSEKFETKVNIIDKQHQQIFDLLNQLLECCQQDTTSPKTINNALHRLNDYSRKHFMIEESLMENKQLDERHFRLHRMEHFSFMEDIENMWTHARNSADIMEFSRNLVVFITNWWHYHILNMDRSMSAQLAAIKQGKTPKEAYDTARAVEYDDDTTHFMMNAIAQLWRIEKKLDSYTAQAKRH